MSKKFEYTPLKSDELDKVWEKHVRIIQGFIARNNFDYNKLYIDEKTVMAVISKVDQRKKYFEYFHKLEMSEYKEAALICFWYMKLKPICVHSKQQSVRECGAFEAINEKLAVYYIIKTLKRMLKLNRKDIKIIDSLPEKYLQELIYSFAYRDISKEALILLVESIAVFLGLNPYEKNIKEESNNKDTAK